MADIDKRKKFLVNVMFIAVICIIVYFFLKYLLVWMLPFAIGFLCSLVLQHPVRWLHEKTRIPKGIWSTVLVTVILTALFALIGFAGYKLYTELFSFLKDVDMSIPELTQSFKDLTSRFSEWTTTLPDSLAVSLEALPANIISKAVSLLSDSASTLAKGIITNIPGLLLTVLISIVACCFMTARYSENTSFILNQLSPRSKEVLIKSKRLFMENIMKMLRGYIIILFITFIELFIGFTVMGLEYAFILAVLIAIMDILPIVGTGTALIPWGLYQLIAGNTAMGLELLLIYVVITVIRQVIEPKIIGKQVGLSPVVTLMAMYLGLQLFGLIGMICLPITVVIIAKLQESGMIKIWNE